MFVQIGGPFCGCPHKNSPIIWRLYLLGRDAIPVMASGSTIIMFGCLESRVTILVFGAMHYKNLPRAQGSRTVYPWAFRGHPYPTLGSMYLF